LAKLQGSIFVDRSRQKTALETARVAKLLAQGRRLVLFPEGTSNDGVSIFPFRSSYFAVAQNVAGLKKGLMIQPVSITYRTRDGLPLVRSRMPALAWYGDMDLLPHLWHLFCEGGEIEVVLQFHKPIESSSDELIDGVIDSGKFQSRKAMARHCHDVVCAGMEYARSRNQLKQGS
jgi:1-acyl-sn-glycerol-3-phosphate acyltransferase